MDDFPEVGEIVIGRITKVLPYGVLMELMEYGTLQGFVHISEVSSSWVKNIRNVVKEGQVRAGKVINVDMQKRHIDISLTKVPTSAQRAKVEEYKQTKRTQKLIQLLAVQLKETPEKAMEEVSEPLLAKYDSLYAAFNAALIEGESALTGVPKKWVAPLLELIEKNFEIPQKEVRGKLVISVPGSDGAEKIRAAFADAEKKNAKKAVFAYEGSGKYSVKVVSTDYKSAEKILKASSDEIISAISSKGGKAEFVRSE
ncbi:MAG: translation initiation factor IF-2 subunit alpha [archaeon]